jgi:DNA-binding response OmpR family regulator
MNTGNKKATIMLVDDTPENLNFLAQLLTGHGYKIVEFPNGEMALRAIAKNPPDLILLDILMPEMDGFEVCRRLKLIEKLRDIPVLFISALDDTANKVKAFSIGGVDYVTKPFQEEEVISRVRVHLELQRQKQEIKRLLNETMVGTIKALSELLAISCPEAYRKTLKIAQYVRTFAERAHLENAWMYSVAANLSNLGKLVALYSKEDTKETIPIQTDTQPDPHRNTYKEVSDILRNIPRLAIVAAMIEKIGFFPYIKTPWQDWPAEILGSQLLTIASGFEDQRESGFSEKEALLLMHKSQLPDLFHSDLLRDFGRTVFGVDIANAENLQIQETQNAMMVDLVALRPGHILAEDLISKSGTLVLSKGTHLTQNLCLLLKTKNWRSPIVLPIKVFLSSESVLSDTAAVESLFFSDQGDKPFTSKP